MNEVEDKMKGLDGGVVQISHELPVASEPRYYYAFNARKQNPSTASSHYVRLDSTI